MTKMCSSLILHFEIDARQTNVNETVAFLFWKNKLEQSGVGIRHEFAVQNDVGYVSKHKKLLSGKS